MGKHRFIKPEPVTEQGICVKCEKNPQRPKAGGKFKAICRSCERKLHGNGCKTNRRRKNNLRARPYRVHLGPHCSRCGFVPEHEVQLDIDHIDEDHGNNDPSNLQTLCACCHRLKTLMVRHGLPVPEWKP